MPLAYMRANGDISTDFIEETCVSYNNRLGDPINLQPIAMLPSYIVLTTKRGS